MAIGNYVITAVLFLAFVCVFRCCEGVSLEKGKCGEPSLFAFLVKITGDRSIDHIYASSGIAGVASLSV